MVGEEVVGDGNDGVELMPLQQPSHHVLEAGGDISGFLRIRRRDGPAAVLGRVLYLLGNSRRTGNGCRQVCRVGVFVTLQRGLVMLVNDALARVLAICTAAGHRGSPDLDRNYC